MEEFYNEDGIIDWDREDRYEKWTEIVQGVFIEAKKNHRRLPGKINLILLDLI